jgi:hypothetical protein
MDGETLKSKSNPLVIIFLLLMIVIVACIFTIISVTNEPIKPYPAESGNCGIGGICGSGHGEGNPETRSSSVGTYIANIQFQKNATTYKETIMQNHWTIFKVTEDINYDKSRFNLTIGNKYQFNNVNYNTLKSVIVYHHVKFGLNNVTDCDPPDVLKSCYYTVDNFFMKWDSFYPNAHPVSMTKEELMRPIPTPVPTIVNKVQPTNYTAWYDEITFNQRPIEEQQFKRIYPINQ